ncbi:response regulator [Nitrospira calida]|jgi:CheY-like chemotaxis protein
MSILIVDDSSDERELLRALLEKEGYRDVLAADSAAAAFRLLGFEERSAERAPVDLVLMDLLMPEMDGLEACRRIKQRDQLRDVPIIVITVKTEPEDLRTAFHAGAMDYIRKPVNPVELAARVSSALALKSERERRKARERELVRSNEDLQRALRQMKILHGLLPICVKCKRIRNDQGAWQRLEDYLHDHSDAEFSHGVCTTCMKELYPDM